MSLVASDCGFEFYIYSLICYCLNYSVNSLVAVNYVKSVCIATGFFQGSIKCVETNRLLINID